MTPTAEARRNMVDSQLRTFDVSDRAVLAAMDEVPRERFVPAGREALAYGDKNLVLPLTPGAAPEQRVMLAPMVLGRLLQALDVEQNASVLLVGGGLGYTAALLARLGARVTLLESRPDLLEEAKGRLAGLGFAGIQFRAGPLEEGCQADRPFDGIVVEGAVEAWPATLLEQLADGGRLACLSGDGHACHAVLHVRAGSGFGTRTLFDASAPALAAFRKPAAFVF